MLDYKPHIKPLYSPLMFLIIIVEKKICDDKLGNRVRKKHIYKRCKLAFK